MRDGFTPSPQDVERVGRFLDGVSRGAVTELSQLLGQQVAYWRFKNAVNAALKAQQFLKSKGLTMQQLSAELRVIVPLIEGASYEDEPNLQAMWASLLAASISPEFDATMHPKYSEVLRQISPLEAQLLNDIYNRKQEWMQHGWVYAILESESWKYILGIPSQELQPLFVNLDRLNLIQMVEGRGEEGYFLSSISVRPFLLDFMEQCTYGRE